MDRYIGLDAHTSSCTLAVPSPSGKRLGSQVVETNARCPIEAVRQIPARRHIGLEEGSLWECPSGDPETAGNPRYPDVSVPLKPAGPARLLQPPAVHGKYVRTGYSHIAGSRVYTNPGATHALLRKSTKHRPQ